MEINQFNNLLNEIKPYVIQSDLISIEKYCVIIQEVSDNSLNIVTKVISTVLTKELFQINNDELKEQTIYSIIKFLEYVTLGGSSSIEDKFSSIEEDSSSIEEDYEKLNRDAYAYYNFILDNILERSNPIYKVIKNIETNFIEIDLNPEIFNCENDEIMWNEITKLNLDLIYTQLDEYLNLDKELNGDIKSITEIIFIIYQCDKCIIEQILLWKYKDDLSYIQNIISNKPISTTMFIFLNEKCYKDEELMKILKSISEQSIYLQNRRV